MINNDHFNYNPKLKSDLKSSFFVKLNHKYKYPEQYITHCVISGEEQKGFFYFNNSAVIQYFTHKESLKTEEKRLNQLLESSFRKKFKDRKINFLIQQLRMLLHIDFYASDGNLRSLYLF